MKQVDTAHGSSLNGEQGSKGLVTVRVFGGMGLNSGEGPLSIGGPRQRKLLALLALRNGSVASVDWLAEYLWDDSDRPVITAPAIRTYMSGLRQALPEHAQEWLSTESSGYRLNAPSPALEHLQFADLRTQAANARSNEDTVLIGTTNGVWATVPLRTDHLIASAAAAVTRGFTAFECSTYRIDPCPTLDEIRSR